MKGYEAGTPSYFATRKLQTYILSSFVSTRSNHSRPCLYPPAPTNLIYALEASLKTITEGKVSLEDRFKMHRETSTKFKKAMKDFGFKLVRTLSCHANR